MSVINHISNHPKEVEFIVSNPKIAYGLGQKLESLDLSESQCKKLMDVKAPQIKGIYEKVKSHASVKSFAKKAKEGNFELSEKERNYLNGEFRTITRDFFPGDVEDVSYPFILAIFTMIAIAIYFGSVIILVVAVVVFVLAAIVILGGIVALLLWLLIPGQFPDSSGLRGGKGGHAFMDAIPATAVKIAEIDVRHNAGDVVCALRVHWMLEDGTLKEGKWSSENTRPGVTETITLKPHEFLVGIKGKAGANLDQISFITTEKDAYGPYGGSGGTAFDLYPELGSVMGFEGRTDRWMHAIGVMSGMERKFHGKMNGEAFCDSVKDTVRISKVGIRHGANIDAIQFTWEMADGTTKEGDRHGGIFGDFSEINLAKGEEITEISGVIGNVIDQLTFKTNKNKEYGPYGQGHGSEEFTIKISENERLLGLFGRSYGALDGIGALISKRQGLYTGRTRTGGANGKWLPGHPITFTSDGRIFLGQGREVELYGTVMPNGVFEFNDERNVEFTGKIQFLDGDSDSYFWGNEIVHGGCFKGALYFKGIGLDYRGRLK